MEQRELVDQFYMVYQEPNETVSQFVIRFQTLHSELTRTRSVEETKAVFLDTLREPLRTMLTVFDLWTSTIDEVVDRVLEMDRAQNSNHMAMGALQ